MVEMLTVILIIAVLMGATSTAVVSAKNSAKRMRSQDLARQLVTAWNKYLVDERSFPEESKFSNGNGAFYPASAENIMNCLNTQYNSRGEVVANTIYFEMTKAECEAQKESNNRYRILGGTGIRDDWKNPIYFTLDFDMDGIIQNVPTTTEDLRATSYAYSTGGGKKASKFIAAW